MYCHDDAMTPEDYHDPHWEDNLLEACRDGFEPRDGFELPSAVCRDGFESRDDSVLTRYRGCGDGFGHPD
jgi:hypothetical protein